ncbi:MAG: glycosyltransferase, partial [Candidatus Omnitrophica bacterium]|nr:glycosyltransferase [Candidatus Omnitrophota bacterium]
MSNDPPKISLIIPAYNEADRIAASLETVSKFVAAETGTYEVLLVNDGSRDRTPEIVREISPELFPDGNFQLLEYGENR